ncbi:MAG: hypothetical protein KKA19_04790 [Candidatus Margulisbacteria bacterium]|nr:hypothetical protein [Candidatus Margulisiibacteriota bacterium]
MGGILAENLSYEGFVFKEGTQIALQKWGNLEYGTLAKDAADPWIKGRIYAAGTEIHFDFDSKFVKQATLQKAVKIGGIPVAPGKTMLSCAPEILEQGVLSEEFENNGFRFKEGTIIRCYPNGVIKDGTLVADMTVNDIKVLGNQKIRFDKNGVFRGGILAEDTEIKGMPCKQETAFMLHDNDTLSCLTLAKEYVVDGKTYPAGTSLKFTDQGILEFAVLPDQALEKKDDE